MDDIKNIVAKNITELRLLNNMTQMELAAKGLSDKYIVGDPNRQELLEKALEGIFQYKSIVVNLLTFGRNVSRHCQTQE